MTRLGIGAAPVPHGDMSYRIDGVGERVAVLPATCVARIHSLDAVGYRAFVTQGAGMLKISCTACAAAGCLEHFWSLALNGRVPERAELNDEPYRDLARRVGARPLASA